MRNGVSLAAVLAFGLAVSASGAMADEEKIPILKVPKVVVNAVEARFPGAVIAKAERETEEGKTFYELSITHKGQKLDVTVMADGEIAVVEKEIKAADLPAAVSKAIQAKYPRAEIKKAEETDEHGKITYEVVVEKAPGKRVEIVLDKTGKIVDEADVEKD